MIRILNHSQIFREDLSEQILIEVLKYAVTKQVHRKGKRAGRRKKIQLTIQNN